MATTGISSGLTNLSQSTTTATPAPSSSSTLNQNDFLTLLTAQLKNQDPENPVDDTTFASQLAQFSTLSGVQQLNTSTTQMLQLQQISQGASLVGKSVTYGTTAANAVQGTVDAVNLQGGNLQLQIGGTSVPSNQLQSILS